MGRYRPKPGMAGTQKLLLALSDGCKTLEELEEKTGLSKERIIYYMYRYKEKGVIYRKWRHIGGRKYREYCLKKKEQLLS